MESNLAIPIKIIYRDALWLNYSPLGNLSYSQLHKCKVMKVQKMTHYSTGQDSPRLEMSQMPVLGVYVARPSRQCHTMQLGKITMRLLTDWHGKSWQQTLSEKSLGQNSGCYMLFLCKGWECGVMFAISLPKETLWMDTEETKNGLGTDKGKLSR